MGNELAKIPAARSTISAEGRGTDGQSKRSWSFRAREYPRVLNTCRNAGRAGLVCVRDAGLAAIAGVFDCGAETSPAMGIRFLSCSGSIRLPGARGRACSLRLVAAVGEVGLQLEPPED